MCAQLCLRSLRSSPIFDFYALFRSLGGAGAAQLGQAQDDMPVVRNLTGTIDKFEGDRSKALEFEKQFGIYRLLNTAHPHMRNPMQRVALALSHIKGP